MIEAATYAIVDVETTGIDAEYDRVVEIACVVVRAGREVRTFSSLVDPARGIPARASAVHHLTDDDVRGEPALETLAPILATLCDGAIIVAHNAAFDLQFLPMLAGRPVLCTLRLARHCFPELESHANQVLRYALETRREGETVTHRALADARVTAAVLGVLLRRYLELGAPNDLDALLAFARAPIAMPSFPFGKHRRVPIADVPRDYLEWILRCETTPFDGDVRHTASTELTRRDRTFSEAAI